jgi:hypothetical protein
MFALRADTVQSAEYFQMLNYICTSEHTTPHLQSLGNVCLQFLLFCRHFWTRKGVFSQQLEILRLVVNCNPAAVGEIGGWERKRNAYDQFRRKTLSFLKHFSPIERNEVARILLEAAPHVNAESLSCSRWVARRNAFLVRLMRPNDDVGTNIVNRLPEILFRKVVMFL